MIGCSKCYQSWPFDPHKKFNVLPFQVDRCRIYLSSDGTEIQDEEYFATIPDQSLLVVAGPKEEVKTDFQLMLDSFRADNATLLGAANSTRAFVENNRERIKDWLEDQMTRDEATGREKLTLKSDDPEWFQGTDLKYNNKEEVMFRRAQDRIRGYFYKAKDELTKTELYRSSAVGKRHLDGLLRLFRVFLHGCQHFGCLFDRSRASRDEYDAAAAGEAPLSKKQKTAITEAFLDDNLFAAQCRTLCNAEGAFVCQGPWDEEECRRETSHWINPYSSRENLIVFQTWNLDHQIEFGRSVIPRIVATLQHLIEDKPTCPDHKQAAVALNSIRFFLELFTTDNFKLVHIACHIKEGHSLVSEGGLVCGKCPDYIKMTDFLNKVQEKF